MHISVDQTLEVAEREDARVAAYLDRLDLRRRPETIAGLVVDAGLVRLPGLVAPAEIADGLVRCYVAVVAEVPAIACTGRAWVAAARRLVGRWRPSRWTVVEEERRVEVKVHLRC